MIYFSPSKNSFFVNEIHGKSKPYDCIEISNKKHNELLAAINSGLEILVVNGDPVAGGQRQKTEEEIVAEAVSLVTVEISVADIEINKHQDNDPRATATEAAWRAYRCQLRDYVKAGVVVGERPVRPV